MSNRVEPITSQNVSTEYEYDVGPPPPPREEEAEEASNENHLRMFSEASSTRHRRVIKGRIENRTRTNEVVPLLALTPNFTYDKKALVITSLLNYENKRSDYRLKPFVRSPNINLFTVAARPHAKAGQRHQLSFYLSDERGRRSNTAEIMIRIVRRKRPAVTPMLLGTAAAAAALLICTAVWKRRSEIDAETPGREQWDEPRSYN